MGLECSLFSFDFFEPFKSAKKGDYIVLSINKTYTCLSIFEKKEKRVILEELTYMQSKLDAKTAKKHFENLKQPSSHTFIEIDLEEKECLICYDAINKVFLDPKQVEPLLLKLFNLDFKLMKKDDRRKVGVLDLAATMDHRPLWNPSYSFDGLQVKGHSCEGFRATIPDDVKFIGGKYVEIYQDPTLKDFCFPVWMQIADDAAAFKLLPLDMGRNFHSNQKKMPRPIPYFASFITFKESGAEFEFETSYPIQEHKFFLFDHKLMGITQAKLIKNQKLTATRYLIGIEKPQDCSIEYGIYSTLDSDKELLVESIQTFKFP